jgi:hypothetical protein
MGAWEIGSFDNDDALDWLAELEECEDEAVLAETLRAVTDLGDGYLEAPEASEGLAAAEIIAALKGRPVVNLPENARAWVEAHRELEVSELVPMAREAVERVRGESELKELWDESDEAPKWYGTLDDLERRLNGR